MTEAAVLASFSTGDSGLPLRPIGAGRYAATWAPANAGSQANMAVYMTLLEPGDIIIDGGNSNFPDSIRRTKALKEKEILFYLT